MSLWDKDANPFKTEEEIAREAKNGQNGRHFTLVRFGNIELGKEPPYLVQHLIPREGLVVVWGPPKCGKTFWTFDVMMHVALRWNYRDHHVEGGTVVYIACEGERGLAARKEAFRQAKLTETDDPPFYLLTTRLDLAEDADALIFDIAAQLPDSRCSAIVLDTLNRSIGGSESNDEDMGAYIKAADKLREKFGCAVVIIHHCGINDKRPRGHTSLTGAADAQIRVERNKAGDIFTEVEFMKDGTEGYMTASRLEVVELGVDDNGDTMTSCVIQTAAGATATQRDRKKRLTPTSRRAFELLGEAIKKAGHTPPSCDHIPANADCVPVELFRKYSYAGQITQSDKPAAKRQAVNRSLRELLAAGYIGAWNELLWIVPGA
jgi:hypothetical protein